MTAPKINCLFIRKNGKQCSLKPDSDLLSQGYCFRHRITEKEEPPAVEINKVFCSFICSNGKQCNLKPDSDLLSQGCCFRHRITKKKEKEHVHVDINKDFCSFILKNGKQCRLKPEALGCCYLHKIVKKSVFDWFQQYEKKSFERQEKTIQEQTATRILKDKEITTKEEWKGWIRKNHPDKGGDNQVFIDILKAGRIVFI